MTLQQYIDAHDMTGRAFALAIGTSEATVSRLLNGKMRPGLELAAAIERETGGNVPAVSWVKSHLQSPSAASPENAGGM